MFKSRFVFSSTTTFSIRQFVGCTALLAVAGLFAGCDRSGTTTTTPSASESSSSMSAAKPNAMDDKLVAQTKYGKVRGAIDDGIFVFKGIRYGADTATTRFQPPKPPAPWQGIKDATAFGNSAPQIPTGSGGGLFNDWRPDPVPALDEDCLFLNVWTPGMRDGGKRPVLVWFHGGGFSSGNGASNAYNGVRLGKRGDVVVVTVNHRLNYFGYLYLGEFGEQFADSGNAGMLDLVQSLEWVRDNIAEFGGDPDNVLIFGESGGGSKVSTMMSMDVAKGLFHRAVIQSGPTIRLTPQDSAAEATDAVVAKLGLDKASIGEILTMPVAKIEEAARAVSREMSLVPGRGPVVDGRTVKRHPWADGAPAQSSDVPLLIGTTRTENSLLQGSRNPSLWDLDWVSLPEEMASSPVFKDLDVEKIISEYRSAEPDISAPMVYFTATTDAGFLNSSVEIADKKSAQSGAPAFMYLLNWDTPVDGGKWGSPHALDIGMVFDNVAKSGSMSGTGSDAQNIADQMSEAWIAFAKTGNPNHPGIPQWPAFDAETRPVMVFDTEAAVVNDPRGPVRKLFIK